MASGTHCSRFAQLSSHSAVHRRQPNLLKKWDCAETPESPCARCRPTIGRPTTIMGAVPRRCSAPAAAWQCEGRFAERQSRCVYLLTSKVRPTRKLVSAATPTVVKDSIERHASTCRAPGRSGGRPGSCIQSRCCKLGRERLQYRAKVFDFSLWLIYSCSGHIVNAAERLVVAILPPAASCLQ